MPFLHTDSHSLLSIVEMLCHLIAMIYHFLNIFCFDVGCSVENIFVELFNFHL